MTQSSVRKTESITIADLLIWTTVIAAFVAWYEFVISSAVLPAEIPRPIETRFEIFSRLYWSICQGTLFAVFISLLRKFFRTGVFVSHPGHWIGLINGALLPFSMLGFTIIMLSRKGGITSYVAGSYVDTIYRIISILIFLASLIAWGLVVRKSKRGCRYFYGRCWQWFYLAVFAELASSALIGIIIMFLYWSGLVNAIYILQWVATVGSALALVAVCAAVIGDFKQKNSRDWQHWIAIAVFAIPSALELILSLFVWSR